MENIWNKINWAEYDLIVYNLQCKIFESSRKEKNLEIKIITRVLQKRLLNLQEAKAIAIRKVTQDNKGIDAIKSLTVVEKVKLLSKMRLDNSVNSIRKIRPVGILTIEDIAKQALVLLALEPEWEALFEINSYGHRPGYSEADAKWAITRQLQGAPKFILDADIEGCFSNIDHDYLLDKLKQSRMVSMQIKSWLKAGILQSINKDKVYTPENIVITQQSGVLSPLLSNIALHGMENKIQKKFGNKLKLIRYSYDFLIIGKELNDIKESKIMIENFLKPIGLKLSEEKTSIKHSLNVFEDRTPGVNFLGFHFKNISCSVHLGVKSTRGVNQTFRQQCFPSKKSVEKHKINLKKTIAKYKNAPLEYFIEQLSSIIRS